MINLKDLENSVKIISTSLESEDRRRRKRVMEDLRSELSRHYETFELPGIFEAVRNVVWLAFSDNVESVRDTALELALEVIEQVPYNNKYVEEVLPIVLLRLGDDQQREPAEELRLKLTEFLYKLIVRYQLSAYVEEITNTLTVALTDKFPKVRQESCRCLVALVPLGPQFMHENAHKLVTPILKSFKHHHAKTRIQALVALEAVLRDANWKHVDAQLVFGSLAERLFDDNPGVRRALVGVVGQWLVDLRDRYSFFHRLLPILLTALADDHREVADLAWVRWRVAGRQYMDENDTDLSDKISCMHEMPSHYPPDLERPNLGCRTLVQRYMGKILPPLLKELTNWQASVCVKSSYLLSFLVLHAEDELTQHVPDVLTAMCRVAGIKGTFLPKSARDNIEEAGTFLGCFIPASTWSKMMFEAVDEDPTCGNLFMLAAIIRGSPPGALMPFIKPLADIFASTNISTSMKEEFQLESLKVCKALLDNVSDVPTAAVEPLLKYLCYVTAIVHFKPECSPLARAGQGCLQQLALKNGTDLESLMMEYVPGFISDLVQRVNAWSVDSADLWLFLYLLHKPGLLWYPSKEPVFTMLRSALALDQGDVAVKSHLLACLGTIFNFSADMKEEDRQEFTMTVVNELLIPNLTWRAGVSAENLRTMVLACTISATKNPTLVSKFPCAALTPMAVGALKDNAPSNRLLALQVLANVLELTRQFNELDAAVLTDVYAPILGRLDDIDETIRRFAASTLATVFTLMEGVKYTEEAHASIFAHIVSAILVYLDDDSVELRNSVFDAMKLLAPLAPKTIREKLKEKQHLMKSQELCNELLQLAQGGNE